MPRNLTLTEIDIAIKRMEDTDGIEAHGIEDQLYIDFITYVAETDKGQLGIMAKHVLKARDLDFERYYA